MIDQFSFERIHVHVVKFFDSLLQAPHIKIIEATLPESTERIAAGKWQTKLSSSIALLAAQASRDALLQHLNHSGRRPIGRLADQQVDVLRHDDIAHEGESIVVAGLAKNLDKGVSSANRAQQRQASIASEGDKVQMAASIMADEFVGHGKKEKSKPRPSRSGRVGHPEGQRLRKMQQQVPRG
jgi:hypothetical protein